MITATAIAEFALGLFSLALAALFLTLLRQIGTLSRRLEGEGATVGAALAAGDPSPRVEVTDSKGTTWALGEPSGGPLSLLFVSAGCPSCESLLASLAKRGSGVAELDTDVLLVGAGEERAVRESLERHGLDGLPFAVSEELARQMKIPVYPYSVILSGEGKVAFSGGVRDVEGWCTEIRRVLGGTAARRNGSSLREIETLARGVG